MIYIESSIIEIILLMNLLALFDKITQFLLGIKKEQSVKTKCKLTYAYHSFVYFQSDD